MAKSKDRTHQTNRQQLSSSCLTQDEWIKEQSDKKSSTACFHKNPINKNDTYIWINVWFLKCKNWNSF